MPPLKNPLTWQGIQDAPAKWFRNSTEKCKWERIEIDNYNVAFQNEPGTRRLVVRKRWIDEGFKRCAIWSQHRKTPKTKPKNNRATSALRKITKLQNKFDDLKAKYKKMHADYAALRKELVEAKRARNA